MKIPLGVGAGGASSTPDALAELVRGLDDLGFDSLWLSEGLTAPSEAHRTRSRCGHVTPRPPAKA